MDDMENIVLITFSDVLQDCGKVLGYSSLMFILLPGSQTFILKKKKYFVVMVFRRSSRCKNTTHSR